MRWESGRVSSTVFWARQCPPLHNTKRHHCPGPAPAPLHAAPGRQPCSLPSLTPRIRPSRKETCSQQTRDKEEEAGDSGPDAGFFCTSVFLTPQPVAAYNKTEIRKSNQNTHPKAKNPRLKQGAAWPPGGGEAAGGLRGRGNTCPGWEETQHKIKTNQQKIPPNTPAGESQKTQDCPVLSPVSTWIRKLDHLPGAEQHCPAPALSQRAAPGDTGGAQEAGPGRVDSAQGKEGAAAAARDPGMGDELPGSMGYTWGPRAAPTRVTAPESGSSSRNEMEEEGR